MQNYRHHKVLLVGDGAVGSSFAFSILQVAPEIDELVIVDRNPAKANGDVMDLQDVTPLGYSTIVRAGEYQDAKDADIVVITAGVPRKAGETRLDLVKKNVQILKSIVTPVVSSGFGGIFVIASNPVDILTTLTQRISGFPKDHVIGTGTLLDTARLKVLLSERLRVPVSEIDAQILGEHGDTSFAAFDEATVNGKPLKEVCQLTPADQQKLLAAVRQRGGEIISQKGATFFGVARSLAYIVKAILENQNVAIPVSAPLNGEYDISGLYLGVLAVVNTGGVRVIHQDLSPAEQAKLQHSARKMMAVLSEIE